MDEMLICLVRRNELLYNNENKFYNDSNKKEETWAQIGLQLNIPGTRCKSRWSNLRDQYRRALRNKRNSLGSLKRWKYDDDMAFLLPFFQEKDSIAGVADSFSNDTQSVFAFNISDNEVQIADAEEEESIEQSKKKRRKSSRKRKNSMKSESGTLINYVIQQKKNEDSKTSDADYSFFVSMAETVKSFSPINKNLAKRKIFEIVSQIEMDELSKSMQKTGGLDDKSTSGRVLASPCSEETAISIKMSPHGSE